MKFFSQSSSYISTTYEASILSTESLEDTLRVAHATKFVSRTRSRISSLQVPMHVLYLIDRLDRIWPGKARRGCATQSARHQSASPRDN